MSPDRGAKPTNLEPNCRSCRYYVALTAKVGIPFKKGWEYKTEMNCEQHSPYVRELRPCPFYQREPGSDDA